SGRPRRRARRVAPSASRGARLAPDGRGDGLPRARGRSGSFARRPGVRDVEGPLIAFRAMPTVYLNGRFLPESEAGISPLDRGFLFADAIYEVVRYDRGRPYRLAEHLERMKDGLAAIRIAASTAFFEEAGQRLLAENGLADKDAFVYAQVSR